MSGVILIRERRDIRVASKCRISLGRSIVRKKPKNLPLKFIRIPLRSTIIELLKWHSMNNIFISSSLKNNAALVEDGGGGFKCCISFL